VTGNVSLVLFQACCAPRVLREYSTDKPCLQPCFSSLSCLLRKWLGSVAVLSVRYLRFLKIQNY